MTAAASAAAGLAAHLAAAGPIVIIIAAALGAGAVAGALAIAMGGARGAHRPLPDGGQNLLGAPPQSTAAAAPADTDVLDALPFGLMLVGPDQKVRFANDAFEQIFGRMGLAGQDMTLLRANRLQDLIRQTLSQPSGETLEFTLSRGSAAALKAHVRPLPNQDVLVAIEDETQRKRAEELHRDFVANASHELKTPLAASSGIIETLLGHARDDPEASARFLELLSKQTVRMTGLIEDLLSLNRIELDARVLPNEAQNLGAIIEETVDALAPVADSQDVAIVYHPLQTGLQVNGDHDQLAQLFANLVDNAIKYGGPGTTVRIAPADDAKADPGMIGIAISDEGIGIEREHLPRLTERFYRVNVRRSREVGGTGLGLAIVKHILNRHRGRLEVESTLGEGSCFTVWLPALKDVPDQSIAAQ